MAKQAGHLNIKGKIGGLVYYYYRNTPVIRTIGSKSKDVYKYAPAFELFRQNGYEFGRAQKTKSLIKRSMSPGLMHLKDGYMDNRLGNAIYELLLKDTINKRGERRLTATTIKELTGFEFNKNALIRKLVHFPYKAEIDAGSGLMKVFVMPFIPKDTITAPPAATHFKLVAVGAALNLETKEIERHFKESNPWKIDTSEALAIELTLSLPLKVTGNMVLAFGIQFSDNDSGVFNWKSYRENNALRITNIE